MIPVYSSASFRSSRVLKSAFLFCVFGLPAFSPALAQNSVVTYHNDALRTGLNPNETLLAPSNVNSTSFGKLFTQNVDGQVYGQPLYVPNLSIAGGTHNVVFIVTEHDSVYAFDADTSQAALWHVSFLNAAQGITTVLQADVSNCDQITPEIGITDTPAIDLSTNTLYLVAMTKRVASGPVTTYYQQLHALDLSTHAEKFNGPITIQAVVPGVSDGGTSVTFMAQDYKERSGLLLSNGILYTSWTSHCDINIAAPNYHGWVIGYNASNLQQQKGVYNVTPNGNQGWGAIWSSGDGPAADTNGNLYFETSNGDFDGPVSQDYGDCFVKLSVGSGGALAVTDYFAPFDQASLSSSDADMGSVGLILLPDSFGSGAHPHLVTGADKNGRVYLLNRDNLGGYNGPSGPDTILQEFQASAGTNNEGFCTPACFNGNVYWGFVGEPLRAFAVTNALYNTTPTSQSADSFSYPGCVPSISSNGNANGIVWAIQPGSPAVLKAYDASDLTNLLYDTTQNAGDDIGNDSNKFTPPSIINGKVYVPTSGSLVVYGLLATPTPTGTPPTATPTSTRTPTSTATPTPTKTATVTATFTPGSSFYAQAWPNETDGQTPVRFMVNLTSSSAIHLSIYDAAGELIYAHAVQGAAGWTVIPWTGQNQGGDSLAEGIYLYRIESGDNHKLGKIYVHH